MKAVLLLGLGGMLGTLSAATLSVAVEHRIGAEELRFDQSQKLDEGRTLRVSRLDYLITEFALLTPDGRALRADGQAAYISAGQGRMSFALPAVPEGAYAGVAFRLGVPEAMAGIPEAWSAGHALNPAVNGLHWSWQGGYVFLALEGRMNEAGFSYHLARPENLMTVRLERPFTVTGDGQLRLEFNVEPLFAGRTVQASDGTDATHSAPGDPVAVALRRKVAAAWTLTGWQHGPVMVAAAGGVSRPRGTHALTLPLPSGFPAPELPSDNPLTEEGVALGKRLFHEVRLSSNQTQSCASCHQPAHRLAEPRPVSVGADGKVGRRNAPALQNLAWQAQFAWDGRRSSLREAALAPISDEVEMALPLDTAVRRLAEDPAYQREFAAAFGGDTGELVTAARLGMALEQYLLTRIAASSKFDRVLRGDAQLTEEEGRGFVLFHTEHDPARGQRGADCFHCHGGFDFSDRGFHDTGLSAGDPGRWLATGRESDRAKFKTPSLRNVAHTAPYFHDGRAVSLEDVVAQYNRAPARSKNLDPNLAKRGALALSADDQRALVAFLKTLSDEAP